tara:strand:+ start:239 stop:442 length:204 start_codon:yes stop_codon:yes gene_type:complete
LFDLVNMKKNAVIHNILQNVGKKKSLKYTLGRKNWTQKHISTMKKQLSRDRFAVWYKNYMKELGQDK